MTASYFGKQFLHFNHLQILLRTQSQHSRFLQPLLFSPSLSRNMAFQEPVSSLSVCATDRHHPIKTLIYMYNKHIRRKNSLVKISSYTFLQNLFSFLLLLFCHFILTTNSCHSQVPWGQYSKWSLCSNIWFTKVDDITPFFSQWCSPVPVMVCLRGAMPQSSKKTFSFWCQEVSEDNDGSILSLEDDALLQLSEELSEEGK